MIPLNLQVVCVFEVKCTYVVASSSVDLYVNVSTFALQRPIWSSNKVPSRHDKTTDELYWSARIHVKCKPRHRKVGNHFIFIHFFLFILFHVLRLRRKDKNLNFYGDNTD